MRFFLQGRFVQILTGSEQLPYLHLLNSYLIVVSRKDCLRLHIIDEVH